MNNSQISDGMTPSQQITAYIESITDWRGALLARLRKFILETAPELGEEWKWGTPVFSYNGNVVAVGAFKDHFKLNFFKGASLNDPQGLFNAGLDAKATRGIHFHEGVVLNEAALQELIRSAVALHVKGKKK